jgi:peptidyl-prolyl cis-trans isomerase-like protein 2
MGKKSASKDRAYQTATEWRTEGGGHAGRLQGAAGDFRRLPFSACAISFQPFDDPVATADGTVFDIVNAVPYVQKFRRNPATGAPLELKDLVRLHFHRNADGEFACPVLGKVFNEHTHIVAVRTSGNVYCWEALDQLCLKPRNLRDLLTDEPFARADVIHIQDPQNLGNRNLAAFDHVVKSLRVEDEAERAAREADPMFGIRHVDADTRRALDALGSGEAGAALAAGGGGRKAQAERLLADAKAAAAAAAGAAGGAPAAAAAAAGSDPRLRSAPASGLGVTFKPGTSTWNTDAPAAPAPAAAAGGKAAPKDDPSAGRPVPAPYSQRYVAHHTSTGAASRSLTSSSQAVAIRNERTMVLQELKPDKKG